MKKLKKPIKAVVKAPAKFDPAKAVSSVTQLINYSWNKVPAGTWFSATLNGKPVIGRVQKLHGRIYLCSSSFGSRTDLKLESKFGFSHSRNASVSPSASYLVNSGIFNFKLLAEKPKGFEMPLPPINIAGYDVIFSKGYINVGCTVVSNKEIREVLKRLID